MYSTIQEFVQEWNGEAASTQNVFDALTDASLKQEVSPDDRTLGRIAWHVATSIPGMLAEFGLKVEMLGDGTSVPSSAKEIAEGFRRASTMAVDAVSGQWTDASLKETHSIFGRELQKGVSLSLLVKHLIHHRGQMTVLMRQAGLRVPGVYGPAREDWAAMGVDAPTV